MVPGLRRWLVLLVALVAAGAVVLAGAGDDSVRIGIGIFLVGTALVGAVGLAFYAVGLSEDRDREREGRMSRGDGVEAAGEDGRRPAPRRARRPSGRTRSRLRRPP